MEQQLSESRLFSFLDSKHNINIHFLEGQKLIADLVLTHNFGDTALNFYRESVLSSSLLLKFLKPGEQLGLYIDSEAPYFRFKLEITSSGQMRTLLLPEEFNEYPKKIDGQIRLMKMLPGRSPYTSVIESQGLSHQEIINKIFRDSYQMPSHVFVSPKSDQAIMISELPGLDSKKVALHERTPALDYYKTHQEKYEDIFSLGLNDVAQVVERFETDDVTYLSSQEVKFKCSCSKEVMKQNLAKLPEEELNTIIEEDGRLEVRCDYCNSLYHFGKTDLQLKKH